MGAMCIASTQSFFLLTSKVSLWKCKSGVAILDKRFFSKFFSFFFFFKHGSDRNSAGSLLNCYFFSTHGHKC